MTFTMLYQQKSGTKMDLFNLSQEPMFLNEWKKFTAGLKQVENKDFAQQINVLMDELKDVVQKIDVGHDSDFNGYINPHGLIDTRHKIQDVRQKIYQKFSEMGITVR